MIHNTGITAETSSAALVVDGAQPVWMTLNEARERAFTGEIVFETNPEVLTYLDHGIVYYAERVTDASLGRRLLDAGVLDVGQLDRGTVRVGDIEHLGRLFDRDPSVDRDAVVVVAETATEELIADLANQAVASARVTAYRHHPSGVHRWFVAPLDPAAMQRPVSAVAQLDSTVVDQLPGLPFSDAEELTIEWDDQIDDELVVEDPATDELDPEVFELSLDLAEFTDAADVHEIDDVEPAEMFAVPAIEVLDEEPKVETADEIVDEMVEDMVDEMVEDTADETVADAVLALDDLVDVETVESADDFEFSVVWPDGSEAPAAGVESMPSLNDESADEPIVTESDDGNLAFTMPPLQLSDEPEAADAEVPDDVADAVRRAIAAIESAGVAPAHTEASVATDMVSAPTEVTSQLPQMTDDVAPVAEAAPVVEAVQPAGFGAFAPPTMATRAEVLYGQMTDDGEIIEEPAVAPSLPGSSAAGGVASVVFVDDPAEDSSGGDNDRSSALRRLIGSLRRKDH